MQGLDAGGKASNPRPISLQWSTKVNNLHQKKICDNLHQCLGQTTKSLGWKKDRPSVRSHRSSVRSLRSRSPTAAKKRLAQRVHRWGTRKVEEPGEMRSAGAFTPSWNIARSAGTQKSGCLASCMPQKHSKPSRVSVPLHKAQASNNSFRGCLFK